MLSSLFFITDIVMRTRIASGLAGLAFAAAMLAPLAASAQVSLASGDLIKTDGNQSVYYFGADGKRYVFPNEKTYFTWYSGFDGVKTIPSDQLALIPIGGNVTYRPGSRMVKIATDPKVYAVSKNGILCPIASETVAAALFGTDWNTQIDDVPDAFFTNYRVGFTITDAAAFNKSGIRNGDPSINVDKLLANPPLGFVDIRQNVGFTPSSMTAPAGTAVTWISLDSSAPTVASNPHPTHTDIPGFETTTVMMGQSWSFTFTQAGTWGYHNHNFPDQGGTVTVQ